MSKKVKIWLPDDWENISDQNPEGPLTVAWSDPAAVGAFQLSTAEYIGGPEPRSRDSDLIQLAVDFGEQNQWGKLQNTSTGNCVMGLFGTAVFTRTESMPLDDPAYCQVWYLSNGTDFVFATFIAMETPQDREVRAAQRIAEGIDYR